MSWWETRILSRPRVCEEGGLGVGFVEEVSKLKSGGQRGITQLQGGSEMGKKGGTILGRKPGTCKGGNVGKRVGHCPGGTG